MGRTCETGRFISQGCKTNGVTDNDSAGPIVKEMRDCYSVSIEQSGTCNANIQRCIKGPFRDNQKLINHQKTTENLSSTGAIDNHAGRVLNQ